MKTFEKDMLELLINGNPNMMREMPGGSLREVIPSIRGGVLTDVDISMTVVSDDGKCYELSYNRDGELKIRLVKGEESEPLDGFSDYFLSEDANGPRGRLRNAVYNTLLDIRFSRRASGTFYLVEAVIIILSMKNEARRLALTKEIYPRIARIYNVSPVSVERAIRKAIEGAWSNMSLSYAITHYPFEYTSRLGRPTNQEFIFAVAGMIRRSYPEYAMWCRETEDPERRS